jgi:hypothetical protein
VAEKQGSESGLGRVAFAEVQNIPNRATNHINDSDQADLPREKHFVSLFSFLI